jgi:hypothetical protein
MMATANASYRAQTRHGSGRRTGRRNVKEVGVLEVHDLAGVLDDGRGVRRKKVLGRTVGPRGRLQQQRGAVAAARQRQRGAGRDGQHVDTLAGGGLMLKPQQQRRAAPRRHRLIGEERTFDNNRIRTLLCTHTAVRHSQTDRQKETERERETEDTASTQHPRRLWPTQAHSVHTGVRVPPPPPLSLRVCTRTSWRRTALTMVTRSRWLLAATSVSYT